MRRGSWNEHEVGSVEFLLVVLVTAKGRVQHDRVLLIRMLSRRRPMPRVPAQFSSRPIAGNDALSGYRRRWNIAAYSGGADRSRFCNSRSLADRSDLNSLC